MIMTLPLPPPLPLSLASSFQPRCHAAAAAAAATKVSKEVKSALKCFKKLNLLTRAFKKSGGKEPYETCQNDSIRKREGDSKPATPGGPPLTGGLLRLLSSDAIKRHHHRTEEDLVKKRGRKKARRKSFVKGREGAIQFYLSCFRDF